MGNNATAFVGCDNQVVSISYYFEIIIKYIKPTTIQDMLVFVSGLQILVESIKKVLSDFVLNCLSLEMVLSISEIFYVCNSSSFKKSSKVSPAVYRKENWLSYIPANDPTNKQLNKIFK